MTKIRDCVVDSCTSPGATPGDTSGGKLVKSFFFPPANQSLVATLLSEEMKRTSPRRHLWGSIGGEGIEKKKKILFDADLLGLVVICFQPLKDFAWPAFHA